MMGSIGQIEHRFVSVDIAFQDFTDSSFGSSSRRPNLKEIGVPTRIVGVREIPPVIYVATTVRIFLKEVNFFFINRKCCGVTTRKISIACVANIIGTNIIPPKTIPKKPRKQTATMNSVICSFHINSIPLDETNRIETQLHIQLKL